MSTHKLTVGALLFLPLGFLVGIGISYLAT